MAIYRFSFDDKYAGHTATVLNGFGAPIDESPITLDAAGDGRLSLPSGRYYARVDNSSFGGDGDSTVDGTFDLDASLDAAGGGGGGALLDGTQYFFECNNGKNIPGDGHDNLTWDTVYGPDTGGYGEWPTAAPLTGVAGVAGVYVIDAWVGFDNPAQDRLVSMLATQDGAAQAITTTQGTSQVMALASCDAAQFISLSGVVRLPDVETILQLQVTNHLVATTGSPAALHINYAYLSLTKIG